MAKRENRKPKFEGEVIKNLTCDLCGKKHEWIKAREIEGVLVWQLSSPCLSKLTRQAVNGTNKVLNKVKREGKMVEKMNCQKDDCECETSYGHAWQDYMNDLEKEKNG